MLAPWTPLRTSPATATAAVARAATTANTANTAAAAAITITATVAPQALESLTAFTVDEQRSILHEIVLEVKRVGGDGGDGGGGGGGGGGSGSVTDRRFLFETEFGYFSPLPEANAGKTPATSSSSR